VKLSFASLAFAVAVAFLAAAGADAGVPGTYSLKSTEKCLRAHGATLGPVNRTDPQRKAVADLAQRTSFEVRLRGASVILAFAKDSSGAAMLDELLTVPNDPYLVRVKSNVILMYRPSAAQAARAVIRCLRP
jgi:hypothetical protein